MAEYHLTPAAADDVATIAEFTRVTWSLDQALDYVDTLYDAFDEIVEFTEIGRREEDLGIALRSKRVASHRIYYRVEGEAVWILRVLHIAQDPDATYWPDQS